MSVSYEVCVGNLLWGARENLEQAEELYEEVKFSNSDCYVSIVKVTREYVKDEYVEYK